MQIIFKITINTHLSILYKLSLDIILGNSYKSIYFGKRLFKVFDRATNLNSYLNNLDDDFKYLFPNLLFLEYDIN